MVRSKYTKLATGALLVGLLLSPLAAAASGPGDVLRGYLAARWKGDLDAARALWDGEDLRRSQALGTSYTGLELRFDDNLLWSAEERAAAERGLQPVVRDSTIETAWARFGVVLQPRAAGTARADTLQYWVRKTAGEWLVSSPFTRVSSNWTMREGRYFRLYASKLRLVNRDALRTLDEGILGILDRLGTNDLARVRLERIKLEFYLCDTEGEMRDLGVQPGEPAYRLAGERIVTRTLVDLNAAARALVHLTLKESPPAAPSFLENGLAAALGGWGSDSAPVTLQRGAALAQRNAMVPENALDATAGRALPERASVVLGALWSETLLRSLGEEKFLSLYRSLSGTAAAVERTAGAAVRGALESATGKSGAALLDLVQATVRSVQPPLAGGCVRIPEETRSAPPVFRWRDPQERWSLLGFETGEDYTFVFAPYEGPMPKWAVQLMDSLGIEGREKPASPPERPPGDPPQIVVLVRERMTLEAEAYESPLFLEQFKKRRYAGELYGLYVSPDAARLYDYRRDVVVGVHDAESALSSELPYYDEPAGRICFRLRRDVFPKPLVEFMAVTVIYTGE